MTLGVALVTASGCGVNDSPKQPDKARPRNSAVAHCAGDECKVRVRCKGRVYVRFGAPPVRIRTFKTALTTSILADFAGSRDDSVIRC